MNRVTQQAYNHFLRLSHSERAFVSAKIFINEEFQVFRKRHENQAGSHYTAINFIKHSLSQCFAANTINGRLSLSQIIEQYDEDMVTIWIPNASFAPAGEEGYVPLGHTYTIRKRRSEYLLQSSLIKVSNAWINIRDHLGSLSRTEKDSYGKARLLYDPCYDSKQHVYFVLDKRAQRVKIGVSHRITERTRQIQRQYETGPLIVLTEVPFGGTEIESFLHKRFDHINVRQQGLGQEWFHYTTELKEFIQQLDNTPIKSRFLEPKRQAFTESAEEEWPMQNTA